MKIILRYLFLPIFVLLLSTGMTFAAPVPELYEGNPHCSTFGLLNVPGSYSGTDGNISWSSAHNVDLVIVKGGPVANLYHYNNATSDSGLSTPTNPNNGQPYGISHIDFCGDFNVVVTKTANTHFDRDWSWDILKTGSVTELLLSTNQSVTVDYNVLLSPEFVDSNWGISGTISVYNPAPVSATVTGVGDVLGGLGSLAVNCGVSFPYNLPAGGTLNCTYATSVINNESRLNTATVTTSGLVGGGSHSVVATFASATISETDECVTVSDSLYGPLGVICSNTVNKTFQYSLDVGNFDSCGERTHSNTASFVTNDTEATGSSTWDVLVDIPCPTSCTLTQGYWKTHAMQGPTKKYDETWGLVGGFGENTTFFSSGQTYYQVLWTAPKGGNVYYSLAHQYIAAELNDLDGASVPANVQTALNSAKSLFETYTPAQVGALKGNNPVRAQFTALAGVLGSYNEGMQGVPHCSE